jgi:zinc D-Ala-D-Ala carboxypeptidase
LRIFAPPSLLILGTVFVFSAGCASHRAVTRTSPPTTKPFTPPVVSESHPAPPLSDEQLLGFKRPEGMVQDNPSGEYALREVMESYWALWRDAQQNGWRLTLVSGYRSFYAQRKIWNQYAEEYRKRNNLTEEGRVRAIMSLAAVPGLSRHHWGTELDISEETLRGQLGTIESDISPRVLDFYRWMGENAPRFGFCKVYAGQKGSIREEHWHWSYIPFSRVYGRQFAEIKSFKRIMNIDVEEVEYLRRNFPKIQQRENRSMNQECFE